MLARQRRTSGHGHKCQHSAAELVPQHIEQIEEEAVIRGLGQKHMIFEVKRNELFGMSDNTAHLLDQILKLTEVLLRSAHRRSRRSGTLQRQTDLHQIFHALMFGKHAPFSDLSDKALRISRHECTIPDRNVENPDDGEAADGFTQRRTANSKVRTEVTLRRESLFRFQVACRDEGYDLLRNIFTERCAAHPLHLGRKV